METANTAVHNAKDPYVSEFYWRLRKKRNKPHKVAIVATAVNCWWRFSTCSGRSSHMTPEVSSRETPGCLSSGCEWYVEGLVSRIHGPPSLTVVVDQYEDFYCEGS